MVSLANLVPAGLSCSMVSNAYRLLNHSALVLEHQPVSSAAEYLSTSVGVEVLLSPRVWASPHESRRQALKRLHQDLTWNLQQHDISTDLCCAAWNLYNATLGDEETTQAYIEELASEFVGILSAAA